MQLMDVLSDVRGIMLRAHYHFDQDEVSSSYYHLIYDNTS